MQAKQTTEGRRSKRPITAAEQALRAAGYSAESAGKAARMSADYVKRAVRQGICYYGAKRLSRATGISMNLLLAAHANRSLDLPAKPKTLSSTKPGDARRPQERPAPSGAELQD